MAELTSLEEKVAEVMGLAQASQKVTGKVEQMVEDEEIAGTLQRMGEEAKQTEERCAELAGSIEGKKTAIEEKARETKQEAEEMMGDYLGDDADALDGLEFMIMAEAGELGHVEIVGAMNEQIGEEQVRELVEFALPVQQRHVEQTRQAALQLAKEEAKEEAAA
jgi:hypothetical protein